MNPSNKENQQLPNIMGYMQENQLPPVNNSSNMIINNSNNNNNLTPSNGSNNHQLSTIIDGYSNENNMNSVSNTNNGNNAQQQIAHIKRRVSKACDHCRKRKIKCDDIDPLTNRCTNCIKYNSECTFIHHDNLHKKKKKKSSKQGSKKNDTDSDRSSANTTVNNTTANNIDSLVATPDMLRLFPETPANGHNNQNSLLSRSSLSYNNSDLRNESNNLPIGIPINNTNNHKVNSPAPQVTYSPDVINPNNNVNTNSKRSSPQAKTVTPVVSGNDSIITRVEQVDRKVSMVIDTMARFEWLVDKLSKKVDDRLPLASNLPKAEHKQYFPILLTTQKLEWVKSLIAKNESNIEFLRPIKEFMTINLKWYLLQGKHLIESPMNTNFMDPQELQMPAKEHAKILLENFNTIIKYHSSIMLQDEALKLYEKYYENDKNKLSYDEQLVLNICLAISAYILICDKHEMFKEHPENEPTLEELHHIEKMTFNNAMYYYHKLVLFSAGATAITGLLLLFYYLTFRYNSELALDALALAIRYAYDMNLNMNFHYKSLAPNDVIKHRTLWWYSFYFDKMVSLILSKPATIKEDDMDILANDVYFETIKYYQLPKHFKNNSAELDKITNLNEALSAIINYSEHFPFFVSFYSTKLITIESQLASVCFSIRSTLDNSFDEIVQKMLDIRADLATWRDSLHPSMRLESHTQYLKMLYAQSPSKSSRLGLEVSCSQVIKCHLHYLYLDITLSSFAISFLLDNTDCFTTSTQSIPDVFHSFCRTIKLDSVQICEVFQRVKFRPYLYPEILNYVLTGMYSLIFHISKFIGDPKEIDIHDLISLLIKAHTHIINGNTNVIPTTNVKENTAIFYVTFFLRNIIKRYKEINPNANREAFDYSKYDEMLRILIKDMQEKKADLVESLYKQNKLNDEYQNTNVWADFRLHDRDEIIDYSAPEIKVDIFGMFSTLTPSLLETLDSAAPFESVFSDAEMASQNDPSLYTSIKLPQALLFSIHSNGEVEEGYKQEQLDKLGNMKNTAAFCRELPLGTLLFDRDILFMKYLNKERKNKISY